MYTTGEKGTALSVIFRRSLFEGDIFLFACNGKEKRGTARGEANGMQIFKTTNNGIAQNRSERGIGPFVLENSSDSIRRPNEPTRRRRGERGDGYNLY
ncbi:hypothetical protein EVAR_26850_1 [Eumeta japonica]|uniref:Uncharacterized protein n=1 Tax=Eumeta variegata TaxID=151549 RepID=A0A4C1VZC4_EUMVA|nr:hypothetical protein EVAR_26850_1 [Eumeta japonica]